MPTPEEQAQSMLDNVEAKTGAPLDHWKKVVAASGLEKHGQIVKLLKTEHGVTHGYANLIAHESKKSGAIHADDADLVASQYEGKEALRPIYDRIVEIVRGFGDDVELAPKKAYVSLRRKKQFGLVQPSTKSRVDLGLKLPDTDPDGRLEASGSFNSMVSHRVRLGEPDDVDDELKAWLRAAYRGAD